MVRTLYTTFETYLSELGVECGGDPREFTVPLQVSFADSLKNLSTMIHIPFYL